MTYQVDSDLEVGIVNTSWHKELDDLELLRVHQYILQALSVFLERFLIPLQILYRNNVQVSKLSKSHFMLFLLKILKICIYKTTLLLFLSFQKCIELDHLYN